MKFLEVKNTVYEMKTLLDGINSSLDIKKINELGNMAKQTENTEKIETQLQQPVGKCQLV